MTVHTPPVTIPAELLERYTLNGRIPVTSFYCNNVGIGVASATRKEINDMLDAAKRRCARYYGATDVWLNSALDAWPVADKLVGVFGSNVPWYECMCLVRKARPLTIEYNQVCYDHPDIRTVTVEQFKAEPVELDAAFSISSFEHDGLGRYGDPLDPDGDLKAMAWVRQSLRTGGLLYLSVPVGHDELAWNAHRIYGRLRLPMLLEGWKLEATVGISSDVPYRTELKDWVQPIFVLRKV